VGGEGEGGELKTVAMSGEGELLASGSTDKVIPLSSGCNRLQHTAIHCSALQRTATHCKTLQYTAALCSALQRTASHCNTLQRTATYCNTLQHTTTLVIQISCAAVLSATHRNTLQHRCDTTGVRGCTVCNTLATPRNTLQHTATHHNTPQHSDALQHR